MSQPFVLVQPPGSDPADEWVRLGVEAHSAGKFPDAERHYRQALRLDPRHVVATQNLAVVYAQTGNVNEGLLTIERASLFDGTSAIVYANRALMCLTADRVDEALETARKGVEVVPCKETRLALALVSATAGYAQDALYQYNQILDLDPTHSLAAANSCFVQTLTPATPAELLAQRKRWYDAHAHKGERRPHDNDRNPDRPLRVGYVSGDFKCHSAAMIFGRVVLEHDPAAVQAYLYSTLPVDPVADGATKRFKDAAGPNWRDVHDKTDEQAEEMIRRDRIDVLVDLAGHTNGGRLALFTRKPAPVQVTAWGFAHGTGLPEVDAFLACPLSVPEEERRHYAERVIDLPCLVTYWPPEYGLKASSAAPYFANDHFTFGSYARYEKMSAECLRTFAEILRRVPNSKLQFKDHAFRRPYSIKRVLKEMDGVDPKRVLFSISTSHPDHMLAHQQADLALDPFPHGGGVVALEQLFMGVPLLTLYGTQPSCRQGASILSAMGRPDWVAASREEYVEKAVALASDPVGLARHRKTLRDELLASPVVAGYTKAVEKVYRDLWKGWCAR